MKRDKLKQAAYDIAEVEALLVGIARTRFGPESKCDRSRQRPEDGRHFEVLIRRLNYETYRGIAAVIGLSHERVRQMWWKMIDYLGVQATSDFHTKTRKWFNEDPQRKIRHLRLLQHIYQHIKSFPKF